MAARRVTLSFDNGPTPGTTERVLDLLEREQIRATFFVVGRNMERADAAALARTAHAAGHWIGNHTYTHSAAFGDRPDPEFAETEIGKTQALIGDLAHPEKLFRPKGNAGAIGPHLLSRAALALLLARGFRAILWNNVPGDWKDPSGWVEPCLAQLAIQDWSVVVLHDIQDGCLARLPEFLDRLRALGVAFAQEFPDSVTLTRAGRTVTLPPTYITEGPQTSDPETYPQT